jgi:2-dehydropantoate 2-reductase
VTTQRAAAGAPAGRRVVILGTGALACLFGARLARAGARVTLVGTWREALATIAERGVRVEEESTSWSAPLATAHLEQGVRPADLVLVLVKSARTRAIAAQAAGAVAPGGTLLTLQNGLGNREALEAALPGGPVAAGIVTLGATLLAPGEVRAHPGEVLLDARPVRERVASIAALLRGAGFEAELIEPFDRAVWRKLAVNCAINPLSALRGVTNGELLDRPADRELLCRAAREVGEVALARGTPLDDDPALLALDVARRTAGNRSSMLQDVARGAPTEIEALNGAIVREGHRLGVTTPVNEALTAEIRHLADAAAPAFALPAVLTTR